MGIAAHKCPALEVMSAQGTKSLPVGVEGRGVKVVEVCVYSAQCGQDGSGQERLV